MGACCSAKIDETARQYVREITGVLRTRDLEQVKMFYRKWRDTMEMDPMPEDRQLEIDMHKMICELPVLEDLHAESLAFLRAKGEAWDVRENNCSTGCGPSACGRGDVG